MKSLSTFILLVFLTFVSPLKAQTELSEIIPCEYKDLQLFTDGYAIATKDVLYGVIDEKNHTIIPFEFDDIKQINEDLFAVKENEHWFFFPVNGKKQKEQYDNIYPPNEKKNLITASKNKKCGALSLDLKNVYPYEYEFIYQIFEDGSFIYLNEEGLKGVKSKSGEQVITDEHLVIIPLGNYFLAGGYSKAKLFDSLGNRISNQSFVGSAVLSKNNEFFCLSTNGQKWQLYDSQLSILDTNYRSYRHVSYSIFVVMTDDYTYGILNFETGNWIFQTEWSLLPESSKFVSASNGTLLGVINLNGEIIVPPSSWEFAYDWNNTVTLTGKDSCAIYFPETNSLYRYKGKVIEYKEDKIIVIDKNRMRIFSKSNELLGECRNSGFYGTLKNNYVIIEGENNLVGISKLELH